MTMPILYLDADDEITSAAARIRSNEADRLAIVLPYGSRLATSRINFRLLAREAAERGKSIEIVAADSSARALATAAGLPVHPSVAAFEANLAGVPLAGAADAGNGAPPAREGEIVVAPRGRAIRIGRRPREDDDATGIIIVPREASEPVPVVGRVKPPVRTGVAVGVALAITALLAIVAVLAILVLPSATIALSPRSQDLGPLADSVTARPDVTTPDPTTLTIPSRAFTFPVSTSQTFSATGVKVTDTGATGSVTFANFDTGSGNSIPSGAIVKTNDGIGFRTLAAVNLPPAGFQFFPPFSVQPSTSSVSVQAVATGPNGNVGPNTIVVVPKGENKNLLKVTNPDATSGGAHTESTVVSQGDVDSAMATLTTALSTALDTKVQQAAGVPNGTTLFAETASLGTPTPTVDPKSLVGTEATQFTLGLSATGTAIGVDASPVKDLAEARLRSHVDSGSTLDPASITIEVGTPVVVGDIVTFPVTMRGTEVKTVDKASLLAAIRGLDLPAARAKLAPFGDATISLWPAWVTSIPTNPDRVTLTIGSPAPAASQAP